MNLLISIVVLLISVLYCILRAIPSFVDRFDVVKMADDLGIVVVWSVIVYALIQIIIIAI